MVHERSSIKLVFATAVAISALSLGLSPASAADWRGGQRGWQQAEEGGGQSQQQEKERRQRQEQSRQQQEMQRRQQGEQRQYQGQRQRQFEEQQRQRGEESRQRADWQVQQRRYYEQDRNRQRVRARQEQERRWGDLRERNWERVRDWGPGFQRRQYYRGPDWNDWRHRHYIERPRYYWNNDRYSRPWFDYGSVTYISIYTPTYIIPYDAYDTYGSTYYGPVACNRDVVGAILGGTAGALIGAHQGGAGHLVGDEGGEGIALARSGGGVGLGGGHGVHWPAPPPVVPLPEPLVSLEPPPSESSGRVLPAR